MTQPDPWYRGWELTEAERARFRAISQASLAAKRIAVAGHAVDRAPIYAPTLDPDVLMPQLPSNALRSLSLFSGGGGLDLGFTRAGFEHTASYEILEDATATLRAAHPEWRVHGGEDGDVRRIDWSEFRDRVDVLHGGPPCQPFSMAGYQGGSNDGRDMLPEYVRAVKEIRPVVFVAENVPALVSAKFEPYLRSTLLTPLSAEYQTTVILLRAEWFGVPQVRKRVFIVGARRSEGISYQPPEPTHLSDHLPNGTSWAAVVIPVGGHEADSCPGARRALGLPQDGYDALAPTIRSSLTGPRHTTSIVSSVSAHRQWERLGIWPNGVAATRDAASCFPARDALYRLSVEEVGLLQGFPSSWGFVGAVYMQLGQIGNAVPPPLAYAVASSVRLALSSASTTRACSAAAL